MAFVEQMTAVVRDAQPGPLWAVTALGALLASALLYGALRNLSHKRTIENMPTALIRSAAQGYTEIRGMAELMDGDPILAPASLRHCVWFKYKIEHYEETGVGRERRRRWVVVEQGVSDNLFKLTDTSGSCAVDPEGAQVHASQRDVWYGQARTPGRYFPAGDNPLSRWFFGLGKAYRYTEHLIRVSDGLYVIGQFTTHGGSGTAPIERDDTVAERLRALKRNQGTLLREFDANHDGVIDSQEWETARRHIAEQVRAEREEDAAPPAVDVIAATGDRRRPFVISTRGEDGVVAFHRRLAILCIMLAAPLSVLLAWLWALRLGG